MRKLDAVVCDFMCTRISISLYTHNFRFFFQLVHNVISFCCVAATASGKEAMIIFVRRSDCFGAFILYAFSYLPILMALYSLSYSSFRLIFHERNDFHQPVYIFPLFPLFRILNIVQRGIAPRFCARLLRKRELVICFWLFWDQQKNSGGSFRLIV